MERATDSLMMLLSPVMLFGSAKTRWRGCGPFN